MRKIADISAFVFICAMAVLSIVSIFGVWDVFAQDVIEKSFKTMGLLAFFSVVILIAEKFVSPDETEAANGAPHDVSLFTTTRLTTVVVLIISAAVLAFFGVLSIWEVFSSEVVWKSVTSLGIVAFSSAIISVLCLKRENHAILKSGAFKMSGPTAFIALVVFVWIATAFIGMLF